MEQGKQSMEERCCVNWIEWIGTNRYERYKQILGRPQTLDGISLDGDLDLLGLNISTKGVEQPAG